jgi:hypothetical protein
LPAFNRFTEVFRAAELFDFGARLSCFGFVAARWFAFPDIYIIAPLIGVAAIIPRSGARKPILTETDEMCKQLPHIFSGGILETL